MKAFIYLMIAWLFFAILPAPLHAVLDFGTLKATPVMIESITVVDKSSVPISFGGSAELEAKTYPEGQSVTWTVTPDQESDAKVDPQSGAGSSLTITPTVESGSGWVIVEASLQDGVSKKVRVYVGCQSCSEGVCDLVGSGLVEIGSIDVRISLGKAEEGMAAGDLLIKAKKPSAQLFTPDALIFSSLSENVTPLYDQKQLKQIITPQALVSIEQESDQAYEIIFYHKQDQGTLDDGLYRINPSAVPISIWRIENPADTINTLIVSEYRQGSQLQYEYSYSEQDNTWSLASGNGLRLETRKEYTNDDGDRIERTTISGRDGIPVSINEEIYHTFEWGEERVAEISDPDGERLTTTISYLEAKGPGYSKIRSRLESDGSWVRYEYDESGRRIKSISPYLDASMDTTESKAHVTLYDFSPLPGDTGDARYRHHPRTTTEKISGIIVAKTFRLFKITDTGERVDIKEQCTQQNCSFGDKTNLRTTTSYYAKGSGPSSQKIKSRLTAAGLLTSYSYETGTFSPSPDPALAVFTPGEGTAIRTSITQGTEDQPNGIAYQSIKKTSITDWLGNNVMQEQYVKTEAGYERINWAFNSYNKLGRIVETLYSNQTRTETGWSCCGKAESTDIYGITIRFGYDDLRHETTRVNSATELSSEYTYDAAGRQLKQSEINGALTKSRTNTYDLSGRLLSTTDPAGLVTDYYYDVRETTIISPGGAKEITTAYADGKIKSIIGSGVVDRFYRYGVNPDGSQWTTVYIAKDNSPRWEKTTRDLLGRVIKIEQPGYLAPQVTTNTYRHNGLLIKTSTTGKPDVLYEYNELGRKIRSGFDINTNGKLDLASMDRIQETSSTYRLLDESWWQEQSQKIYATENSDTPTTISTDRTRLTRWTDRLVAEQHLIDINGNKTITQEHIDHNNRARIRKTIYPDSEIPAVQFFKDNLLISSQSKTGHTTSYGYDVLGRRVSVTDPRTGTAILHYNDKHQLDYIRDTAGNRTGFSYDPESGLKTLDTNAMGKKTYYAYNPQGQLFRTWGDVPYPVEYHYNDYGEMTQMYTFRAENGWNMEKWPDNASGDETSWVHHEATGLLLAKQDAKGYGTSYTYDTANRLATRAWARGIVTTYNYLPTGELLKTDYSDDTPDIKFTYDRIGRKKTVTDALGPRSFFFNDSLQLKREEIEGPVPTTIARSYDKYGRDESLVLNDVYRISHEYDPIGRYSTLNWQVSGQNDSTVYRYLDNSDLLVGLESKDISTSYEYDPNRNLKTAVINTSNDLIISKYDYQYDHLGRRINEKVSGTAFEDPAFKLYGYNDRNEIETSSTFIGTDLTEQTNPMNNRERLYQYDPIGNRRIAQVTDQPTEYKTNELNQYEETKSNSTHILSYDLDGNLTELIQDSKTTRYTYNGENQLISVEPVSPKDKDTKSIFVYDYMGRRVDKKTSVFSLNSWHLESHISSIYNGSNLISETDVLKNTQSNYVWGLDLSQSRQGPAGGTGGLLAAIDNKKDTYRYFYDNIGNVSQLIKNDGSLAAHYEYEPFGNLLAAKGSSWKSNPFRFSTKYLDGNLDLYNYGYRYLHPQMGRWMNKDPLGEQGGNNLYSFALNSINNIDSNGLYVYDIHYLAVFATLQAAGKSPREAWQIAYYSAYPDMDENYDAMSNFFPTIFGSENSIKYQEYLHSLNGKNIDEIEILRKCAECLISNHPKIKNGMSDDSIDGILLHLLGDTYGHLKMEYIRNENLEIIGYGTTDEAYSSGLGHGLDLTFPDMVGYRPQLATDYLMSVFNQFGAKDSFIMGKIIKSIENLQFPNNPTPKSVYETMFKRLMNVQDFWGALPDAERDFNPTLQNVISSKQITPNSMVELLDMLIDCSEEKE